MPIEIEGSPAEVSTASSGAIKKCIDELDDWAGDAIERMSYEGKAKTICSKKIKQSKIRLDLQGQTTKHFANLQLQYEGKTLACVLVENDHHNFGREKVVAALKEAYQTKNKRCLLTL